MKTKKICDLDNSNKINIVNNLNDFFIKIDYFDEKGNKKYKNNIPLKYILNKNISSINQYNLVH